MKVVVAPDSFTGTLSSPAAATAIAEGWRRARPDDEVTTRPMSDGGDGLLEVLGSPGDSRHVEEVVGPLGLPVRARWLLRPDGTAVVESARACGIDLVPPARRDPRRTTTWGVGQLLDAARRSGARRVLVGMGGSATVDGGAGALGGLGFRLTAADGGGLKIGGGQLHRIRSVAPDWVAGDWDRVRPVVLCDVRTRLLDAPARFGPQKGADEEAVDALRRGLERWADVVEADLAHPDLRAEPGTGAAGGLAFGLAAGLDARLRPGAAVVAEQIGLPQAVAGADLVVTGEGTLDGSSLQGKVVGEVLARAGAAGVPVAAVVGVAAERPEGLADLVEAAPQGPGGDAAGQVTAAATALAGRPIR